MDDPALARLCFVTLLIVLTWGGIHWAVTLP